MQSLWQWRRQLHSHPPSRFRPRPVKRECGKKQPSRAWLSPGVLRPLPGEMEDTGEGAGGSARTLWGGAAHASPFCSPTRNSEKVGGSLCIPWQRTVKAVLISPWNGSERSEQLGTRNSEPETPHRDKLLRRLKRSKNQKDSTFHVPRPIV